MKFLGFILTIISGLSLAAETPIITKSNGRWQVPTEQQRWEVCEVFRNEVVITKKLGFAANESVVLTEKRSIRLDGNIEFLLASAAKEELQDGDYGLCNNTGTTITAGNNITLFQTGSCGYYGHQRNGTAGRALIEIANTYCPFTYGKPQHF